MRVFTGIDKSRDPTAIAETDSPENSNCFFAKGKQGMLGQRLGKTRKAKYPTEVWGYIPILRPNGDNRIMVGLESGDVVDRDRDNQANTFTLYPTGDQATGKTMATTSLTLTEPATSAELITTFSDASTYDPSDSLLASWGYSLAMGGNGSWTSAKTLRIRLDVNVGSVAYYSHTFNWKNDFSQSWTLAGMSPAAIHQAPGTILGMCVELSWPNGWPSGTSGSDTVTISSLLMG